jgi:GGDEF domain-containing protein
VPPFERSESLGEALARCLEAEELETAVLSAVIREFPLASVFVRFVPGPELPSRCADGGGIRLFPPGEPVPPLLAVTVIDGDDTLGWIGVEDGPRAGFERGEMRDFLLELSRAAAIPAVNVRRHAAALEMAMRDPLTGLFNRRALEVFLGREAQIALRYQRPLSVVIADLDRFKEVNDRHGHAAGDRVLRAAGRVLSSTVRRADLVVRFGGDEFVVLLPDTPLSAARQLAQRLGRAQWPP